MKKKNIIIIVIVALVVLAGAEYWYAKKGETIEDTDTIKIGAILPLTGDVAALGESAQNGLLLAEKIANKDDTKYKLKFYFEDGVGNPAKSVSAAIKLLSMNKINILFSTVSRVDMALVDIQRKYNFLMFSHAAHPALSNIDSLFFRNSQTVQQESKFICEQFDSNSTIALCYMDDDFGVAFSKELNKNIPLAKLKASFAFPVDETNFTTLAKKIIESNANTVVICAGGKNVSSLVRKINEQNFEGKIITSLSYIVSGANELTSDIKNLSMVDFKKANMASDFRRAVSEFEKEYDCHIGTTELMFFHSAMIVYNNYSSQNNQPNSLARKIKEKPVINICGSTLTITEDNDILPELTIVKN